MRLVQSFVGERQVTYICNGHILYWSLVADESLSSLVLRVVDIVGDRDIPVIAAGGIVDARGFFATEESYANPIYKRKVIELDETEYTDVFGRARWPSAPHRVLQTSFFKEWRSLPIDESEANKPVIGQSTIPGVIKFRLAFISLPEASLIILLSFTRRKRYGVLEVLSQM
ncbi:unnamed protein product [Trifolium pratense]|uniref:Uncharacterized protein n=1 Tax=Trifolium pratense TaxID=57577 RepID=A0ACB0JB60_TRIPR|nr:unnamed protein product [Trifolium pratense]